MAQWKLGRGGSNGSERPAIRSAHNYSLEDFKIAWSAVREFVLIETLDDGGKSQGEALMRMEQMYQADNDGAFALTSYVVCSDEYYQYGATNEMSMSTCHHFCRTTSLRQCKTKVRKEGIVHVLRWSAVTSEAEKVLLTSAPEQEDLPSASWGSGDYQQGPHLV